MLITESNKINRIFNDCGFYEQLQNAGYFNTYQPIRNSQLLVASLNFDCNPDNFKFCLLESERQQGDYTWNPIAIGEFDEINSYKEKLINSGVYTSILDK